MIFSKIACLGNFALEPRDLGLLGLHLAIAGLRRAAGHRTTS
jgi:hypothetical protein